ncbi:MAG: hypothetical protein JWM49_887 [Microbacteriaceae bacterium]|nr:hypothetical protein [Microbacteriaceae bacterium]
MIDFTNGFLFKLAVVNPSDVLAQVEPLFVADETIMVAAKAVRDYVVFTNKRIIAVNVQGMTGKKRDFSSLPYSKIQAFSVETAGTFDLDAELELWFSGLGKVRFEFKGSFDITYLGKLIGGYVLG